MKMDKCRICSSTNYKDIRKVKSPYFDAFYTLYECSDCKCRFFDARENEDISLTSLYESFADKNNQMLDAKFTPTPYWKGQVDILNKYKNNEIIFLYDVAYLEYTSETDKRLKMLELLRLEEHVMTVLAFSGSKTFGVYGLRLGAAIGLTKSKSKIEQFRPNFVNEARGSWSATPTISIELLNHFSQKENLDKFNLELDQIKSIVQKRSELFISQANQIGLKTYPFRSGFYVIVLTDKPMDVFEKLVKQSIYVVPMENGIRIALCSISKCFAIPSTDA